MPPCVPLNTMYTTPILHRKLDDKIQKSEENEILLRN